MADYREQTFKLDALPERKFAGFSIGDNWNGWACPYFERVMAEEILSAAQVNGFLSEYDAESDTFTVRNNRDGSNDASEVFVGLDIEVEGRSIHVYPIGAYSWIWDCCEA